MKRLLGFALPATLALALTGSALADPLTALSGYWTLDETSGTRADELGTYDLTDAGSIGYTEGAIGNAAVFTGTPGEGLGYDGDVLTCSDQSCTIALWWKPADTPGEGVRYTLAAYGDNDSFGWWLYEDETGVITFRVDDGAGGGSVSTGAASAGEWHQVTAWHHNFAVLGVALDGVETEIEYTNSIQELVGRAFTIGSLDGTDAANGALDEAGYWNEPLASEDRALLYNGGAGCGYPFTGCESAGVTGDVSLNTYGRQLLEYALTALGTIFILFVIVRIFGAIIGRSIETPEDV